MDELERTLRNLHLDFHRQLYALFQYTTKTSFGASSTTNCERMNFMIRQIEIRNLWMFPPKRLARNNKNDEKSLALRKSGNESFFDGEYILAVETYTQSLAVAATKPYLAIAYANRSAALFRLGLHQECLIVSTTFHF